MDHGPAQLSSSDSCATVLAKANTIYTGFQNNLGANTVGLPINTYTVGTTGGNWCTGAIDAATAKGFKVVLSYWDDGVAASGGRIVNTTAFNNMWNTVVARYGTNDLVYFEPMNSPAGTAPQTGPTWSTTGSTPVRRSHAIASSSAALA